MHKPSKMFLAETESFRWFWGVLLVCSFDSATNVMRSKKGFVYKLHAGRFIIIKSHPRSLQTGVFVLDLKVFPVEILLQREESLNLCRKQGASGQEKYYSNHQIYTLSILTGSQGLFHWFGSPRLFQVRVLRVETLDEPRRVVRTIGKQRPSLRSAKRAAAPLRAHTHTHKDHCSEDRCKPCFSDHCHGPRYSPRNTYSGRKRAHYQSGNNF